MWGRWYPNDEEHRLPPPPTAEWLRRLAVNRRHFLRLSLGAGGATLAACGVNGGPAVSPAAPTATGGGMSAAGTPTAAPERAAQPVEKAVKPGQRPAAGATATPAAGSAADRSTVVRPAGRLAEPVLVVVQLSGGNDGLNTVIPYTENAYRQARPTLAVPAERVLALNDTIGLHPNLARFKEAIWAKGRTALVQGVGYPSPSRSHFRSMDIWQTAEPTNFENYGWLGRYLDIAQRGSGNPFIAVNVGGGLPKALWARETPATAIRNVDAFSLRTDNRFDADRVPLLNAFSALSARGASDDPFFELVNKGWTTASEGAKLLQGAVGGYRSPVNYPQGGLARNLQTIAGLLHANLGTRLYYTQLGGFDDHANEKNPHERRLSELSDSLAAFYQDLEHQGILDNALILTFSEFGRRVRENASGGTDHGAAQPLFLIGGRVKGGIYGKHPSLADLDDGDLKFDTDFRAVYNMVLSDWLGVSGRDVLGKSYDALGLIK